MYLWTHVSMYYVCIYINIFIWKYEMPSLHNQWAWKYPSSLKLELVEGFEVKNYPLCYCLLSYILVNTPAAVAPLRFSRPVATTVIKYFYLIRSNGDFLTRNRRSCAKHLHSAERSLDIRLCNVIVFTGLWTAI